MDWTKLETSAGDKINSVQIMISAFDGLEIIVKKGENAGYKHFLLFPQCFQKLSLFGSWKVVIVW